ncbi:hypothetical protein CXF35_10695 [Corynebacterium bovis]|uniref:Uncharacterized protein n=1 Tax=Corynebacterium bovis TaxID=36808 RepID=A0A426Q264_9CORY|nr:hypothetical protein CXF40_11150 [Corynebacterium bovis]RRQ01182.1 hypothetical protein CXF42_11125 [Corynebacterium bovis]RRQ02084.1 hypothetical protein CXF41_01030 [Corynebacterium bovis]RRQ04202.1 hypothetical protein CXF34_10875 [Corynebacterium bovis]RRQ06165.1 hypothetical protein CXF35_10695 [Corynebacterium bovis]
MSTLQFPDRSALTICHTVRLSWTLVSGRRLKAPSSILRAIVAPPWVGLHQPVPLTRRRPSASGTWATSTSVSGVEGVQETVVRSGSTHGTPPTVTGAEISERVARAASAPGPVRPAAALTVSFWPGTTGTPPSVGRSTVASNVPSGRTVTSCQMVGSGRPVTGWSRTPVLRAYCPLRPSGAGRV